MPDNTRLERYLEDANESPRFDNGECPMCVFLGHYYDPYENTNLDLYYHFSNNDYPPTVVARWGEGGDYYSGIEVDMPALNEAKQRVFRYFTIQELRK